MQAELLNGLVKSALESAGETLNDRDAIELALALLRGDVDVMELKRSMTLTSESVADYAVAMIDELRRAGLRPNGAAVVLKMAFTLVCRMHDLDPELVPEADVIIRDGECGQCMRKDSHGHAVVKKAKKKGEV